MATKSEPIERILEIRKKKWRKNVKKIELKKLESNQNQVKANICRVPAPPVPLDFNSHLKIKKSASSVKPYSIGFWRIWNDIFNGAFDYKPIRFSIYHD